MKAQLEHGSFAEKEHNRAELRKKKARERYQAKKPRCVVRWNGRFFVVEGQQTIIHPLPYPEYIASITVSKKEENPRFLTIIASTGQMHRSILKREDDGWFIDWIARGVLSMERESGARVRVYKSVIKNSGFETTHIKEIKAINYNPKKGLVTLVYKTRPQKSYKLSLITLRLILWIFMRRTRQSLEATKNGRRGKIVRFKVIPSTIYA